MKYTIVARTRFAFLILVVLAFIGFSLPPYLTLDPARSRIAPPTDLPAYYPLLVAHVVFASLAMSTACLQMWPWLRQSRPRAHRALGRCYVFAGVVPAGLAGLVIGAASPFGPILRVSNVLLAILWLTCTLTGFRMARRGELSKHRRWMIRSFALTLSVITNRFWGVLLTVALTPQLATSFGGNETWMVQTIAGLSGWLGWVLPLMLAEWWLVEGERTAASGLSAQRAS